MGTDKNLPKINAAGIAKIKGKDFVSYEAKLDYAHQYGMKSLEVTPVLLPSEATGERLVCQARLVREDGGIFIDIADATPDNIPKGCVDSYIRIASTRAKSRVIEDAYNVSGHFLGQMNVPENNMSHVQAIDAKFTNITEENPQYMQAKNDGGGTKPATDRQLHLIKSLASQQSLSLSGLANDMFHKSIAELQGSEASQMIKRLKKEG